MYCIWCFLQILLKNSFMGTTEPHGAETVLSSYHPECRHDTAAYLEEPVHLASREYVAKICFSIFISKAVRIRGVTAI